MSRNGSGVYSIPPGTEGIPNTPVESEAYNSFVHDVEFDLNWPRPVVAGGTGASNAATARTNLGAETAGQQVTNYDSHTFVAGSFWSATNATGEPVDGHAFAGIAYLNGLDVIIEATDLSTRINYIRAKISGAWGAWAVSGGSGSFVLKTGDAMSGTLSVTPQAPATVAYQVVGPAGANRDIAFRNGFASADSRWLVRVTGVAESGSNAGSDFNLISFNDTATVADTPLSINRATGLITIKGPPTIGTHAVNKDYADLKAPLLSPALTGTPTAPTPAITSNTTRIATTEFVKNSVQTPGAPPDFDTLTDPGTYWHNGNSILNGPLGTGLYWMIQVMRYSGNDDYVAQLATQVNITTPANWWIRNRVAAVWQPWRNLVDSGMYATGAEFFANTASKVVSVNSAWNAAAALGFSAGAASFTPNLANAADHYWTLNNTTGNLINPSGAKLGQKGIIVIVSGVAGTKTMTWGTLYKFPGGIKPVLTSALNAIDVISYVYNNNVMLCNFSADMK